MDNYYYLVYIHLEEEEEDDSLVSYQEAVADVVGVEEEDKVLY